MSGRVVRSLLRRKQSYTVVRNAFNVLALHVFHPAFFLCVETLPVSASIWSANVPVTPWSHDVAVLTIGKYRPSVWPKTLS